MLTICPTILSIITLNLDCGFETLTIHFIVQGIVCLREDLTLVVLIVDKCRTYVLLALTYIEGGGCVVGDRTLRDGFSTYIKNEAVLQPITHVKGPVCLSYIEIFTNRMVNLKPGYPWIPERS